MNCYGALSCISCSCICLLVLDNFAGMCYLSFNWLIIDFKNSISFIALQDIDFILTKTMYNSVNTISECRFCVVIYSVLVKKCEKK